jgi:phosphoribosylanthranilate isomerase
LREELLNLHHTVVDEESRVELMRLFNVIADIVQAHLEREGQDVEAFQLHRQAQIWQFLRAESLVDGTIDRDRLLMVTSREVAAGRLRETDEIHLYALGDDQAFDSILTEH